MTTWETQAGKFTTLNKVKVELCLPELSATKILTWKFHMDYSTIGRYNIILGRYLLTDLGLDFNFSNRIIVGGEGPYEGFSAPMFDVSNYDHAPLTDKIVKPDESFLNLYVDECFESKNSINPTRRMQIILNANYKKSYLNNVATGRISSRDL